jgi:putative transposase
MDGRGRALDNVFIERLWRSLKYEEVYLKDYDGAPGAIKGISAYLSTYNTVRLHESLGYRTPEAVYLDRTLG